MHATPSGRPPVSRDPWKRCTEGADLTAELSSRGRNFRPCADERLESTPSAHDPLLWGSQRASSFVSLPSGRSERRAAESSNSEFSKVAALLVDHQRRYIVADQRRGFASSGGIGPSKRRVVENIRDSTPRGERTRMNPKRSQSSTNRSEPGPISCSSSTSRAVCLRSRLARYADRSTGSPATPHSSSRSSAPARRSSARG